MVIVAIEAHAYQRYQLVLSRMFRTRKEVFSDALHWNVTVVGDAERDKYDDMGPIYLLWCNEGRSRHYASMRLMPTTGSTLLYDVFRSTFPEFVQLSGPGIWEGTRMCVDESALARDLPDIAPSRAFSMLLVALCEFALDRGIHTMVSNYEPYVRRLYARAGVQVHELGRADGFGRHPVCCGAFKISTKVLETMRATVGLRAPLYRSFGRTTKSSLSHRAA